MMNAPFTLILHQVVEVDRKDASLNVGPNAMTDIGCTVLSMYRQYLFDQMYFFSRKSVTTAQRMIASWTCTGELKHNVWYCA